MPESGDGGITAPRIFTIFIIGTDILTWPPKHRSVQLLMPSIHLFKDRAESSST